MNRILAIVAAVLSGANGLLGRGLMLAAAITIAASGSHAQTQMQRPTMSFGNWYGGIEAGIMIPQDISYRVSGPVLGIPSTLSGNLSFNSGPAVGGFAGYNFNDYLAGEGGFLYGNSGFDKLTANTTGIITASATAALSGSVDTGTFLVNAIVRPLGSFRDQGFSTYIGGGVGFMNHDAKLTINSISALGVTVPVNLSAKNSALDFAADAIAGVDWNATGLLSLGGRYRFLWANLSSVGCPAGATCSQGNFTAHVLTANATLHF
jgi:opacity protein-like surface antigen